MSLSNKPCHVGVEYSKSIYFRGTYSECKQWILKNDPEDDYEFGIISDESGRFMTIVWGNP